MWGEHLDSHDRLWLSREEWGASFHVFVMFVLGGDGQVHPGMNAALEADCLTGLQAHAGTASRWNEQIVRPRRLGHEVAIYHLRAFGGWGGGACSLVQNVNEAAAESLHAGKGVSFASQILQLQCRAFGSRRLRRGKSPGSDGLVHAELGQKTHKADGT